MLQGLMPSGRMIVPFLIGLSVFPLQTFGTELPANDVAAAAERLVATGKAAGVAVAVIQPSGIQKHFFGTVDLQRPAIPNEKSIFEIGSVTKAFTGTLIAQAVLQGKIQERDEAQAFLPDLRLPRGVSRNISVLDILTHRSGISANPFKQFPSPDPLNPWASFSKTNLAEYLLQSQLVAEPGAFYEYNNVAGGLAGYILETLYGASYERILENQITAPLKMRDTVIQLSPEQEARFVNGYGLDQDRLTPVPHWDMPGIPSVGALRSTLADMIVFAAAAMNTKSDFGEAIALASSSRAENSNPGMYDGFFWVAVPAKGYFWHNGSTYGATAFLGINPTKQSAVVILSNTGLDPAQTVTLTGMTLMRKINEP